MYVNHGNLRTLPINHHKPWYQKLFSSNLKGSEFKDKLMKKVLAYTIYILGASLSLQRVKLLDEVVI